ncbi:MAG TPA: hypothetical protein VI300_01900 [Solirubrobacter sp.]
MPSPGVPGPPCRKITGVALAGPVAGSSSTARRPSGTGQNWVPAGAGAGRTVDIGASTVKANSAPINPVCATAPPTDRRLQRRDASRQASNDAPAHSPAPAPRNTMGDGTTAATAKAPMTAASGATMRPRTKKTAKRMP